MTKTRNTRVKVPALQSASVNALTGRNPRTNDDMLLNSSERSISDRKTNQADKQFINCKDLINISFQNVRSLRTKAKQLELCNLSNEHNISILGIADHKIIHKEKHLSKTVDNCTLITSSAWRNSNNAANGGVGLLVTRKVENALSDIEPITERILCVHFNGNPATTVIVHYAPVEGSEGAEDHYTTLANVINSVPKHNITLVLGDCNAHIGNNDAKFTFHESTNTNGKLLLDLVEESNMVITNTIFQKKHGKLWTYVSDMSGSKSQIDYILINRKWKNSVKNAEAYNSFSSVGSDHRIVTAKIKLSLRTSRATPRKNVYDLSVLRNNDTLQQLYTVKVKNRFSELSNESETDATTLYQNLITANQETAKELLPPKKRTKRELLSNDGRVSAVRDKVNQAFAKYQCNPDKSNREQLQKEKSNLKSTYDQVFQEELECMIKQVEDADIRAQHAESWKIINQISGRKAAKKGTIKGKSKDERISSWFRHFSQLLGNEPVINNCNVDEEIPVIFENLGIKTGEFTMEEYQKVKHKLKTGKMPGADEIPPEVLKFCDLDEIVLSFANKLMTNNEKPQQWSDVDIKPLPKSGDLGLTTNYRGIALSAVAAKMVNKMLLLRIQPKLDSHLRPNQNGFRPKRSTTAHILALRRLIEGVKRYNLKSVIVFVDFSKAFDSVHRGMMLKILKAYGIPPQIIQAISKLYEGTRARVVSPDGETDYFDVLAGVLQGDTLAPYLFAIVVDYLMRKAISGMEEELGFTLRPRRSRRVPPITVTDLDFADDIALLCNEIHQAQELLKRVETEAARVGLHVNAKKTEHMSFNQDQPQNMVHALNEALIKLVDNFKYLGGHMKDSEYDIKIRKALAWVACHNLRSIWSSSLKKSIKIRLFLCTVESVLLYNSETWSLTKQMEKSLNGTYTRMLRMALNVSWKAHMTNEQLYGNLPPVTSKIAARRLRLAGHCIRHPEEIASQFVLWEPQHGHTNRGRKPVNYVDLLKRDTGIESTEDLRGAMLDHDVWKDFVKDARSRGRQK